MEKLAKTSGYVLFIIVKKDFVRIRCSQNQVKESHFMLGTIVNAAAIAAGGLAGVLLKKGIKESWSESINKAMGIAIAVIGINGVISNMVTVSGDGKLSSSGELLLAVSLIVGTFIGEVLKLNDRMEKVSAKIEKKLAVNGFAASFMNASILFCVGAMAIIGSLQDGLNGDHTILFAKAVLDLVNAVIFGATLGIGVVFSAIPVFIYQGAITLLAGVLSPYLQGELLTQICYVGYAIIIAIGVNYLIRDKIKVLNMLPSILVPVVWMLIQKLIALF